MKVKALSIVVIVALVAACVRSEMLYRRSRATLVHERTMLQMEAVKNRARDFVEIKLHQKFSPAAEVISPMERYELRITVPGEARSEFIRWMNGTFVQAASVEGWPSSSGSSCGNWTNEFWYRVYYGHKPVEWN